MPAQPQSSAFEPFSSSYVVFFVGDRRRGKVFACCGMPIAARNGNDSPPYLHGSFRPFDLPLQTLLVASGIQGPTTVEIYSQADPSAQGCKMKQPADQTRPRPVIYDRNTQPYATSLGTHYAAVDVRHVGKRTRTITLSFSSPVEYYQAMNKGKLRPRVAAGRGIVGKPRCPSVGTDKSWRCQVPVLHKSQCSYEYSYSLNSETLPWPC